MSIPRQITEYLDSRHVPYEHLAHPVAFTAQETAHAQHVSGKDLAKAVMIKAGKRLIMTVLPASHHVNLAKLGGLLSEQPLGLASEADFRDLFPGCEPGAIPALGNLFNVEVWADASLEGRPKIFFVAGTHRDTIGMSFDDFERLVQPRIGEFAALV